MIREKKNDCAVEKIRVSGMESLYIAGRDVDKNLLIKAEPAWSFAVEKRGRAGSRSYLKRVISPNHPTTQRS